MDNKFLNGIVQTKSPLIGGPVIEYERDILYFVRTSPTSGEEGYLYFNGRKYGNLAEVYAKIAEIEARLSGATDEAVLQEIQNALDDIAGRLSDVEDSISANTEAISTLNGDENVAGSVDQKIKDALLSLPADMVVEDGRVEESGDTTYIVLTIKGGEELRINATDLVDTYTNGDQYVKVENYEISLNIDKIKEALELNKLATKEEVETVSNKVNEVISGLTEVQEAVEGISSDIDDVKEDIAGVESAITKANESINTVNAKVDAVVSAMTDNADAVEELNNRIDSVDSAIAEMEDTVDTIQEKIDAVESAITENADAIANIDAKVDAVTSAVTAIETDVEAVEDKVDEVISAITEIEETVNDLDTKIDDVDAKVDGVMSAVTEVEAEVEAVDAKVDEADAKVEAVMSAVTENETAINEVDEKVDGVISAVTELEAEVEATDAKVDEAISAVTEVETAVSELNTKVDGVDAKVDEVISAVTEVEDAIVAVDEKADNIQSDVDALESKVDNIASAVTENTDAIEGIKSDIEDISDDVATNAEAIEDITDEISAITSAIEVINGDESVAGSIDQKIKDAILSLPADMVVEGGRVEESGDTTYLVLKVKNQDEEVYINATDLVDTYESGDQYVKVENYVISLNIDKFKEALEISKLATKEEVDAVADKVDEVISGLTETQEAIEDLNSDVEAVEGRLDVLEPAVEANTAKIDEVSSAITEAQEAIDNIEADIIVVKGDIDDINEKIGELSADTITLEEGTGVKISGATISANTDATTVEDIQVTVDLGAGYAKGSTIPAGTSVQDIFVKLFSKELWATSVTTGKTFSGSVGKPTVTLSKTGIVEVGTKVNMSSTANETYTKSQTVTAKTMTYGYFDGSKDMADYKTATTYTETLTPTTSGDVKLKSEYTGFTGVAGETVTATTISASDMVVSEGTNTVKISETGATIYAQTSVTEKTLYVATNLKNTSKSETNDSDWVVTIPDTWNGATSTATTSNQTASVTGAYKYYYGYDTMGLAYTLGTLTDETIYGLSSGWIAKDSTTTLVSADPTGAVTATGNIVIAVPSKYMLASIFEKLSGGSILANFNSETRTLNIGGDSTTEYTVYYYSVANAPTYYNVTITEAEA